MNIKRTAYKLQTALCQKGRYIRINQYQTYSEKTGKMVTKYVLTEKRTSETGREKTVTILETYQLIDVVKALAELYGDANGANT